MKDLGYSMDKGVLPVGRLPHLVIRSNRDLGKFGGYFLLLSCIWKTRETTATMTIQKANNSSHVTIAAMN